MAYPTIIEVGLFWWVLIGAALIAWALAASTLTAYIPLAQSGPAAPDSHGRTQEHASDNSLISADTSALIDALNQQGSTNRIQEASEENRKQRLETITILIIAVTGVAILAQVYEMRKVYGPIADQARVTKENMIADHRAWIGPTHATIDQPALDKPIHAQITYNNTGRQPAPVEIKSNFLPFTYDDWNFSGKA
jgi:hypothetical protein